MKKNILYLGLIGLVGLLFAVCSDNGAEPLVTGPGIYSDTRALLGGTLAFGVNSSDDSVTVTDVQQAAGVSLPEGSMMAKINFPNAATWGGAFISSTADPIDILAYADGKLVFSINYADIGNLNYLQIKVASKTAGASDDDGGGVVNLFDHTATDTDGDWRTYKIPLSAFTSIGALDFTAISSYFGVWHPKATSGDANILTGSIYIDDVYLEPATP